MAAFIGYLKGQRGKVSRLGSKASGIEATLQDWNDRLTCRLSIDPFTGATRARVVLEPIDGMGHPLILFSGPVRPTNGRPPKTEPFTGAQAEEAKPQ